MREQGVGEELWGSVSGREKSGAKALRQECVRCVENHPGGRGSLGKGGEM